MNKLSINKFIYIFVFLFVLACIGYFLIKSKSEITDKTTVLTTHEALFYSKLTDDNVKCNLCFRNCLITEGKTGFCFNRINLKGKLYSQSYAQPCIVHVTPVEKEQILHILPGTNALCLGTAGCNFRCKNCALFRVSRKSSNQTRNYSLDAFDVVQLAGKLKCPLIVFTYTEPVVSFEYMLDIFKLASKRGIKTVFHTNGSINPEPLKLLLKYTDGVIVDLKGFSNKFYDNICSARLGPVLHTMKITSEENVHLEIVNLIIPAFNDDLERIEVMCNWIVNNLGSVTPLHFSSFIPSYKMKNLPPASPETLEKASGVAIKCGLKYVYINNFPELKHNSTTCPNCKRTLIKRDSSGITGNSIKNGKCRYCGKRIPGIWE